jgi:hypothetical protein
MTDAVVRRKTHGENVCIIILTQLFTRDCLLCGPPRGRSRMCVVKSAKSSTAFPPVIVGKCAVSPQLNPCFPGGESAPARSDTHFRNSFPFALKNLSAGLRVERGYHAGISAKQVDETIDWS